MRQDGELKAYGAGLLSSYGELEYCMSDVPERKQFDPEEVANKGFPVTEYQPLYYITESFDDAKDKLRYYILIPRSLHVGFQVMYEVSKKLVLHPPSPHNHSSILLNIQ